MSQDQSVVTLVMGDRSADVPIPAASNSVLINGYLTGLTTLQSLKLTDDNITIKDNGNNCSSSNEATTTSIPLSANYSLAFDDYLYFCRGQALTFQDHMAQQLLLANYLEDKAYFEHLRKQVFDHWSSMATMIYSDKVTADVRYDIVTYLPYCLLSSDDLNKPNFMRRWLIANQNTRVTINGQVYCNNQELSTEELDKLMLGRSVQDSCVSSKYKRVYSYCLLQKEIIHSYCIADCSNHNHAVNGNTVTDLDGNEVSVPPIFNLISYHGSRTWGRDYGLHQGTWLTFNSQGDVTKLWQQIDVLTSGGPTTKTTNLSMPLSDDDRCRYWISVNHKYCENPRYDAWVCLDCLYTKKTYKLNIRRQFPEAYPEAN